MRILVILLFIVSVPLLCQAEAITDIDRFLASRTVVGQIFFAKKDSQLSAVKRQQLIDLIPKLQAQQHAGRLVRVEGFTSIDEATPTNIDLSMLRALEVMNFLQQQQLSAELFLTGFGANKSPTGKLTDQKRVDITSYNKNLITEELFDTERFIIQ